MGSDREARAMAAGDTIEVDGRDYTLRPVVIQHLCDIERKALADYKRNVLSTYTENRDILGDAADSLIKNKMEEISVWDLSNLPQKKAYSIDASQIEGKAGRRVRRWIEAHHEKVPETESGIRAVMANALDSEMITPDEVKGMTGKLPKHGLIRYDQWWVTASMNGMVEYITTSLRYDHPDITSRTVANWPVVKVVEAAGIVDRLSAASVGNG